MPTSPPTPTTTARLRELPLGAVRPTGWLADQLRLQAAGQTGQLEQIWPDVGPDSGWLGGDGEAWERGPYYLDGLVPLAYVLDDDPLKAKAQTWIEAILASARPDGWFGPDHDDWWPRMVAAKVLTQYADATGDERVVTLLTGYFAYQAEHLPGRPLSGWGRVRGADNALSVLWLHERTGEPWLLDLARTIIDQTEDWAHFLRHELPPGPVPAFRHVVHGVNVAMGLKTTAVAALAAAEPDLDAAAETTAQMFAAVDRLHGMVHGVLSGDEWLGGRDPHHGVETCLVVELMFTLEQLVRILGEGRYGDLLEVTAYNLLAAANDPRMLAHQYHQQANQVKVSFENRDWSFSGPDANVFGLEPHFGCCTANLHQGWPKLVRSLWLQDPVDEALVVVAYGPCTVRAEVAGRPLTLDVATGYPFREQVIITVGADEPTPAALRLRIPGWCDEASIRVDGAGVDATPDEHGYVSLERTWAGGETIMVELSMRLVTVPRDRGALGLRYGPLVMVNGCGEIWREVPDHRGPAEWEISHRSHWNLGLHRPEGVGGWRRTEREIAPVPFARDDAPVEFEGQGVPLREWRMVDGSAPLPESPVGSSLPVLGFPLVPYGSARIRIAEFPVAIFTGTEE